MPAPSPLKIATQAVSRLATEEKYYQKELSSQTTRIQKLETDLKNGNGADNNAEFMLKQEQKALEETKAVFGPLKQRITEATQRLEEQIATVEGDQDVNQEELAKAKEILASAPKEDA
ncbi:tubulin-specific chaperone [Seiridium cupressi]|uniref:Tubulin-specific chaperone A n=1 Tax=Seiridium unicorne TaxID=138068 RepID=A0ABR2UEH1_9PEZI